MAFLPPHPPDIRIKVGPIHIQPASSAIGPIYIQPASSAVGPIDIQPASSAVMGQFDYTAGFPSAVGQFAIPPALPRLN